MHAPPSTRPHQPLPSHGIASRLGRWSVAHRRKATLIWLALVVIGLLAAGVGSKQLSPAGEASGDSAKAERLLDQAGFRRPAGEEVLVQNASGSIRTDAARQAVRDVVDAVGATDRVTDVRSPFDRANRGQISRDGRSALVLFAMKGKRDTA